MTQHAMPLPTYPEARVVRLRVSGKLRGVHKYGWDADRNIGPYGYNHNNGTCASTVSIYYSGQEVMGPNPNCGATADTMQRTVRVQGQGQVTRGGAGGVLCQHPTTGAWQNCWSWSGEQQVSVEVIDVTATLYSWNGSFKTTIPSPQTLWFNWLLDAEYPSNTPVETMNWWFDTGDTVYTPIAYGFNNQPWTVPKSGTMYVKVKVNGTIKTLSRYIHVGPATLKLTSTPAEVYPGDTVFFRAEVRPDTTSVSTPRWFWFSGTSVSAARYSDQTTLSQAERVGSDKGANSAVPTAQLQLSEPVEVVACRGQLTCDHVVYSDGLMRVDAILAGVGKYDERPVTVVIPEDRIQVTCAPVQRRSSTTCTASSKVNGDSLQVTGWNFVSSQLDAPFTVARTDDIGSHDWSGVVMLSGTVTVRGKVGGVASIGSGVLEVTDNPLTDVVQPVVETVTPTEFFDPPLGDHDLGETDFFAIPVGAQVPTIGSGPNTSVSYYATLPVGLSAKVDINVPAFASTSTFTLMQSHQRRSVSGATYCAKADVPPAEALVRAHEGFSRTDVNSHVQTYSNAWEFYARRWYGRLTDKHTYTTEYVTQSIDLAAKQESDLITHGPTTNPFTMSCHFNYDASVTFP